MLAGAKAEPSWPGELLRVADGPAAVAALTERLRQRVADELKTPFASHYTQQISLHEMLQPDVLAGYNKKSTGEKYLVRPNQG